MESSKLVFEELQAPKRTICENFQTLPKLTIFEEFQTPIELTIFEDFQAPKAHSL
jgi:hypothetical protein